MKSLLILTATIAIATAVICAVPSAAAISAPAQPPGTTAVTCDQVVRTLVPCLPYLTAAAGVATPSAGCCDGVKSLKKMAEQSLEDKRATCECLKEAATRSQDRIKKEVAAQLPKLCSVDTSVQISKDVDCSKISAAAGGRRAVEEKGEKMLWKNWQKWN